MKDSLYHIGRLLYIDFVERKSFILPILIALLAIAIILNYFDAGSSFLIFVFGCFFPGLLFMSDFANEKKATCYLQLPATSLQKLISRMIIGMIIIPICLALIHLISSLLIYGFSELTNGNFLIERLLFSYLYLDIILYLFLLQAILTAMLIKFGNKGPQTMSLICLIMILLSFLSRKIDIIPTKKFPYADALFGYERMFNGALHQEMVITETIVLLFLIINFWIISYYFLREKELT